MNYMQDLMTRQAMLAAAFEREETLRFAAYDMTEQGGAGQTPQMQSAQTGQKTASAAEAAVRELLRRLLQTQSVTEQTAAIRHDTERRRFSGQREQELTYAENTAQQIGGGLAQMRQLMQVSGTAGKQTRRSMAEISRFFERDSRRY